MFLSLKLKPSCGSFFLVLFSYRSHIWKFVHLMVSTTVRVSEKKKRKKVMSEDV